MKDLKIGDIVQYVGGMAYAKNQYGMLLGFPEVQPEHALVEIFSLDKVISTHIINLRLSSKDEYEASLLMEA
jgi:hypothetical protein